MCKGIAEAVASELEKVIKLRMEKYNETEEISSAWVKETIEKLTEQNTKDGYILPLMASEVVNLVKLRFKEESDFNYQQALFGEKYIYPKLRELSKLNMEKNNDSEDDSGKKITKLFLNNYHPKEINRENFFSQLNNTFKLVEQEI